MKKLPKWTERSDIKWRPVSEKPSNKGLIILTNRDKVVVGPVYEDEIDWDNLAPADIDNVAWAWVCWDKT